MKKIYEAPDLEIETYELDASIASNCSPKITFGPEYDGYTACEEFDFDLGETAAYRAVKGISFYEQGTVCTCYYSSGNEGYFTS